MTGTGVLDTGPLDLEEEAPAGSARATITPREAWRKARLPLLIGVLFVALAVAQAIGAGRVRFGYLDPAATAPDGSAALVALLRDRGVDVREVARPSGSRDATAFFPIPELVDPDVVASAAGAADLVIVEPGDAYARATATGVEPRGDGEPAEANPGCEQADAVAAGRARARGMRFSAPEDAVTCYASSFVDVTTATGQRVTILGTGDFMTNEHLDEEGNAALALRLLTRHPTVEWVYPRSTAGTGADEEPRSLGDLLSRRVDVFTWQLVVAALLVVAWRARRLGAVVVEPLPVVVRAAETVEGRARLYQSARARGRAGEALRAGLRDRLVRTLGLAPDASRETLVAAVTARSRGRDAMAVDALLYGPPPADDPSLVRLADDLDSLYSEVRDL